MDADKKRKLAERVVDLTVMNRLQDDIPNNLKEKMQEDQVQLHIKHFDTAQLKALIDFY